MQQLSSFRLFCSPPLIFRPKITQKPLFIIRALASSGSREKRTSFPFRKSIGTQRSPSKEMEETEKAGFNRKRAEGRDNSSKQKILQLKTRKLNPVNTISYVQILGTGMDTQDTSPSVLLFFDKQRFIFNAGEGLQRFCTEHKIKLSKIDHMFLTRVCSETAAGVPGLLLTLAGMGDEGMSVNIWGPSDLKYLMDAMTFIPNAAMVHTHRFGSTPDSGEITNEDYETDPIVLVDDEVIKLSAILLRPGFSNELQNSNECSNLSSSTDVSMKGNIDQLSRPLGACSQNPLTRAWPQLKPGDVSVIYACELPEIKGKFDPAKAAALGLKAGPKYRELQLGNSVKSDRQNIMVHPSDVLGPSIAGPIVLLVDCPTVAHLREMLSLRSLKDYYVGDQSPKQLAVKPVNCVIHLGPAFVTTSPEYRNWMKKFGEAQHIMAGHTMKNIETPILKSSARIMSRLNFVCPQFFPSSGFWSSNSLEDSLAISEGSSILSGGVPAENLLKFHLRPYAQLGLDRSGIPSAIISSEIVTELLSEIPEVEDVSKHVSLLWGASEKSDHLTLAEENSVPVEEPWMNGDMNADAYEEDIPCLGGSKISLSKLDSNLPSCLENIAREDMEIVFLGTGSSQPSKYRNVSSIYINLFSKGSLFLDCGEGTLGQLKRRFGATGADDAIRGLKCIWISHIHADHHTGLARVLAVRSQLLKGVPHDPLLVVGPRQLKRFLDAYARLEDIDMEFLDCRDTSEASWEAFAGRTESEIVTPENVEATLFAKGSRMESFWKRPKVQVSSLVDFPVLKRLKQVLLEAGLEVLISFPVVHCPQAYGIVLKASERINRAGKIIPGWKLVYSGDTRPCQALIDAAHGATILIHEATFEDGMVEEAIARNHSTTKEAIDVGDSAGAYRIILTHFSQRYPKIPVFDESHMHKTCIAFDMMSVNIADLPILPKVLPYLKLLFRNEMVLDEPDGVPLLAMEQ